MNYIKNQHPFQAGQPSSKRNLNFLWSKLKISSKKQLNVSFLGKNGVGKSALMDWKKK